MNRDTPEPGDNGRSKTILARLRAVFGNSADEEDIVAGIENGEATAAQRLSRTRREMIERVAALDEKKVVDVMAPRADIYAVDIETSFEELIKVFAKAGHSRMPIYRGDLDDPVGMVHIKDVVQRIAVGGGAESAKSALKAIIRDVLYVPPSMSVTDLLLRMQASRIHMALVIDEYGGTDGLVTIEDLVEEIVGDINDEHDEEETPVIAPLASGGWDVDARVELNAFSLETGLALQAEDDEIDTIGGYVVSLAGRVPQRGEILTSHEGLDFEVTEADARKVRKVRIRPTLAQAGEAAE